MNVIIQLGGVECAGMECDWVQNTFWGVLGKDSRESIVGSVSFHNEFIVGIPVC